MYKASTYMEDTKSFDELRQHRRWFRIGYGGLALLFTWNLLLSVGLLSPSRGYTPPAEPIGPFLPRQNVSAEVTGMPINLEQEGTALSLDTRDTKDIQARQDEPVPGRFDEHTRLGLKALARGRGVKSGVRCVFGAVSTAIGVAVGVHGIVLIGGRIYDTGVVLFNDAVKRDIEDALSSGFNTQVRHIADWDSYMPYDVGKREAVEPVPVFGMTINDKDMHLTIMPGENNSTRIRIGHGPGPDTESNRRLRPRNEKYNKQIFESGGLDFVVESDLTGFNSDDLQLEPTSQQDFDWIYKQVECYLTLQKFGSFLSPDPIAIMGNLNSIGGLYFQVLNDKEIMTMARGKIAAFSSSVKSMIDEMGDDFENGDFNDLCTAK
ncbi:hypothetical protein NM208_g1000 [Fusarium decemcellulare]|uniref:Uncharacterized protein n=1 Tax=Fusarium decemcellulare TaxID=57161 RepID=A0ACC1SXD3_9HYPO|nr:hypothetical protein NM208_g1000 [Fusarium decemcellulare]